MSIHRQSYLKSGAFFAALLSATLCLSVGTKAMALDYSDVKNLMQNQVSESVVINMVQQSGPMVVTSEQLDELRLIGASETLIAALQSSGAAAVTTPAQAATVEAPSGTITYVEPPEDPIPTTYVEPSTAYVQPSTTAGTPGTYYDPGVSFTESGITYYYDPSTGTYIAGSPSPTVIYESPTYVEVPTYAYPSYPYYNYGPSWGFSINLGGRDRPHYRPGRPPGGGHRPPPHVGGRPPGGRPPGGRPSGGGSVRPGGGGSGVKPGGGRPGGGGVRPGGGLPDGGGKTVRRR